MKINHAANKLTRAGFEITIEERQYPGSEGATRPFKWTARRPGSRHYLYFTRNGHSLDTTSITMMTDGDDHDSMTDYFAGTILYTVKGAIEFVTRFEASDAVAA